MSELGVVLTFGDTQHMTGDSEADAGRYGALDDVVTESYGCVFCDLMVPSQKSSSGQIVHPDKKRNTWVPCTRKQKPN